MGFSFEGPPISCSKWQGNRHSGKKNIRRPNVDRDGEFKSNKYGFHKSHKEIKYVFLSYI